MLAIPNEERDVPKGTQLQAMLAIPNEERDEPKGTQLQAMLAIPNEMRDVPQVWLRGTKVGKIWKEEIKCLT